MNLAELGALRAQRRDLLDQADELTEQIAALWSEHRDDIAAQAREAVALAEPVLLVYFDGRQRRVTMTTAGTGAGFTDAPARPGTADRVEWTELARIERPAP